MSSEIRLFYWAEDARDRYYLAMAHAGLARSSQGEDADLIDAMTFYREAEAAFEVGQLTPENRDLLARVRRKAREVLRVED